MQVRSRIGCACVIRPTDRQCIGLLSRELTSPPAQAARVRRTAEGYIRCNTIGLCNLNDTSLDDQNLGLLLKGTGGGSPASSFFFGGGGGAGFFATLPCVGDGGGGLFDDDDEARPLTLLAMPYF
jgi:hypothetical protein